MMAIDPRIAMGVQVPNVGSSIQLFQNTLNNIQSRKMNEQAMAQNEVMNPLRQQQAQQTVDINQSNLNTDAENKIIQSLADFEPTLRPFLESGNNIGGLQALQTRKQNLLTRGGNPQEIAVLDEAIEELSNGSPDNVLRSLDVVKSEAVNRGLIGGQSGVPTALRTRQALLNDLNSGDPDTVNSARVALGLDPSGGGSAAERIATDKTLGGAVADQEAAEVTATESAKQPIQVKTEALKAAQKRSEAAIDTLANVRSEISNLDAAIEAIDSGAASGKVSNWFPSFKADTIKLRNAASRLGLDVVSATTFGALSEGELKLAMDVAVPTDLQPAELKEWLTTRKNARVKLANELEKMAIALGSGEMTSSEYLKKQKEGDPLGLGL